MAEIKPDPVEEILDDTMPNEVGSSMFLIDQDEEQAQEIREEQSMVTGAGSKLIEEVLGWFDESIAKANNISSLNLESNVSLEAQIESAQQFTAFMEAAKSNLQTLYSAHFDREV